RAACRAGGTAGAGTPDPGRPGGAAHGSQAQRIREIEQPRQPRPDRTAASMKRDNIQIDAKGRLCHLLTIEGMDRRMVLDILDTAESFISVTEQTVKKVPLLRGKTVVNLFFEASPRTRT